MALSLGGSSKGVVSGGGAVSTTGTTTSARGTHVIGFSDANADVQTPIDNYGNKYWYLGRIQTIGGTVDTLSVWMAPYGKGGAGHVVTLNSGSGTFDGVLLHVEIVAPAGKAAVLDKIAKAFDNVSPYGLTSAALSGANEFALTFVASGTVVTSYDASASGYTIAQQETNDALYWTQAVVYKTGVGPAAESPNFPSIGSGVPVVMFFAAFREINAGPSMGAHAGQWQIDQSGSSPASVTLNTQASGSSLVVLEAAEMAKIDPPTYNGGSAMTLLQANPGYNAGQWPGFGYELYGQSGISGGSGHVVAAVKPVSPQQESTLIAIEVLDALTITSVPSINVAGAGAGVPYNGPSITVSGPSMLLATWSGDAGVSTPDQSASVPDEWTLIEYSFQPNTAYIQTAIAARLVDAGTYFTPWTPAVNQGAILGIVAVSSSAASAPTFTAQPITQTVADGKQVTLSVSSPDAVSYQWYSNASGSFVAIGGATSSSYTFTASIAASGRKYYCIATNANGSTQSDTAIVIAVGVPQMRTVYERLPRGGNDVWDQLQAAVVLDNDVFDNLIAAGSGLAKVWGGAAWVAKPVKYWNGSSWVTKPLKRWNGSAWV